MNESQMALVGASDLRWSWSGRLGHVTGQRNIHPVDHSDAGKEPRAMSGLLALRSTRVSRIHAVRVFCPRQS
jgi:hypothetical protein